LKKDLTSNHICKDDKNLTSSFAEYSPIYSSRSSPVYSPSSTPISTLRTRDTIMATESPYKSPSSSLFSPSKISTSSSSLFSPSKISTSSSSLFSPIKTSTSSSSLFSPIKASTSSSSLFSPIKTSSSSSSLFSPIKASTSSSNLFSPSLNLSQSTPYLTRKRPSSDIMTDDRRSLFTNMNEKFAEISNNDSNEDKEEELRRGQLF
jgi:hypothetical protein